MKLKTVPKIRADCISCNGDSSVRIREGINKVVPSFGISVYPLHCRMWEQLILKALRQWAVRVLLNVNKRN